MKEFKSRDVYRNVPGRGDIYVVRLINNEPIPDKGDRILLDGMEVIVAERDSLDYRKAEVGLIVRPPTPDDICDHSALIAKLERLDEENAELRDDLAHLEGRLRTNENLDVEVLRREVIKLREALRLSKEKHP